MMKRRLALLTALLLMLGCVRGFGISAAAQDISGWKGPSGGYLTAEWPEDIRAGIGSSRRLSRQDLSFQAARLAIQSLEADVNFASYESIRLEILLGNVSEAAADAYLKKCLKGLDQADKELLNLYFASEMSLKQTAERGFLHVNTLQYRLNRIRERCGLDPRRFREASLLYTALRVEAMRKQL